VCDLYKVVCKALPDSEVLDKVATSQTLSASKSVTSKTSSTKNVIGHLFLMPGRDFGNRLHDLVSSSMECNGKVLMAVQLFKESLH